LPGYALNAIIMYMSATLPLADVRDRLSPLVSSVESTHERVVITKNGRPAAVLISYEDLESLEETLEVLSDPDAVRAIAESLADPERYTVDDVRRDLQARGQGASA
jgi:antitoxin YefM